MRKLPTRILIASLTLTLGLLVAKIHQHLTHRPTVPPEVRQPATSPPIANELTAPEFFHDDESYPESSALTPYDIEWFIDDHPQAHLKRLWERLNVHKDETAYVSDLEVCSHCTAESFEYDLDGERGPEVLLRIDDGIAETYRYLVFKSARNENNWKLLGHIDAWGKYEPARHLLLLSNGKPWLVVTERGASGSGIALYVDRIFKVNRNGLQEILRYNSSGTQAAWREGPDRMFDGRVASCEVHHGEITVTVAYTVEYQMFEQQRAQQTLFSRRQTAVFRLSRPGRAVLNQAKSTLSQKELESIYNIDSMTDDDFLKYNYVQLQQIAVGKDQKRKRWLRNYLEQCADIPERRQLRKLLAAR